MQVAGAPDSHDPAAGRDPLSGGASLHRQAQALGHPAGLGLINGTADAFLLSIHQNTYPSTQPSGPQTLYSRNETAAALARQLQELLNDVLSPPYRRSAAAAGNDIYLMAHAARPAVLVECGFLSNPREAAALETPVYQKTLSVVLTAGWVRFTGDEHLESENVVLLQGMRQ